MTKKKMMAALGAAFLLLGLSALAVLPIFGQSRLDPSWLLSKADIAFGPAAGTSPTITRVVGNAAAGAIRFTTGTGPVVHGAVMTITFPTPYPVAPVCELTLHGGLASIPTGIPYATTKTVTFRTNVPLSASTPYQVNYRCIY